MTRAQLVDHVIGVDIGTQSTKALLCNAQGQILAQSARHYRPDTPRPLWAEQWPEVWSEAVFECIAACVAQAQADPVGFSGESVGALCISGLYGGSGIPVDAAMKPLHQCLIWMDRRASAEVEWVKSRIDLDHLRAITGNGVDSYYGFTKMLWLREHRPEVWKRTHGFLPPNAYVIHQLTGQVAVDHSSAGNIGGVYDAHRRTWSGEMLDALGIPRSMMPSRLVASSDVVGGLTAAAAERLGLLAGTPVVAGGVDAAVATLAAGATRRGQHVAMLGSSMCWGFISQQLDASEGLIAMPAVFGEERDFYIFGGANTAGAAVTWFRETFCQGEASSSDASQTDLHARLEAEANAVPEGADGLLFLPYLMGERSPVWDGRASGSFVGLSLVHGRGHMYRAVLEGVAFALRHNIEAAGRNAATLDRELIVVGGATHSDLWMQIIADVVARPVLTVAEDVEAAMGAALLAAFGVGLAKAQDLRRGWVSLVPRASPRAASVRRYDSAYASYKAVYPALRSVMHDLRDQADANRAEVKE